MPNTADNDHQVNECKVSKTSRRICAAACKVTLGRIYPSHLHIL